MVHPVAVSLFTPVQSKNPWTLYPALYLSPNCKSIAVLSDPLQVDEKGSKGCIAKPYERSLLATVAIVISFCTIILPLLAMIANIAARGWISGFYYLPVEAPQALSSSSGISVIPSKVEGFTAFQVRCLNAESFLEPFYTKIRADFMNPGEIHTFASKYIQELMNERTGLLKKTFSSGEDAGSEMDFLQHSSEKILLKLIDRNKQYAGATHLKEMDSIQASYQTAEKEINDSYVAQLKAFHKKIAEAKKTSASFFQARPLKGNPQYQLLCTIYPHQIDASTYTELKVFRHENGRVNVEIGSVLFGNKLSLVHPHDKIVWKTAPTVVNIGDPRNWSLDSGTLSVIFNASNEENL